MWFLWTKKQHFLDEFNYFRNPTSCLSTGFLCWQERSVCRLRWETSTFSLLPNRRTQFYIWLLCLGIHNNKESGCEENSFVSALNLLHDHLFVQNGSNWISDSSFQSTSSWFQNPWNCHSPTPFLLYLRKLCQLVPRINSSVSVCEKFHPLMRDAWSPSSHPLSLGVFFSTTLLFRLGLSLLFQTLWELSAASSALTTTMVLLPFCVVLTDSN